MVPGVLIGGSVLCLETRPGPVATAQVSRPHLACRIAESTPNFARNSPVTLSNIEFRSLELQCFQTLLKLRPIELRATFLGGLPHCRGDVAGGSFLVFCWFLLVRNVARLLVERNVAPVWACGVWCER